MKIARAAARESKERATERGSGTEKVKHSVTLQSKHPTP
jgi:hypothetical protein